MTQRLSYEFIKEQIEEINYSLLTSEYTGYYQKLDIICDKGHKYKTGWNIFREGSRCPICYRNNQSKSMLKDFDEIKLYIELRNFKLISDKDDYKGNYSRLNVICPNGHTTDICWAEFRRNRGGCSVCSGVKQKTIEEVREYIEKFNYKCLSKTYKNWESELQIQCSVGHIYETKWAIFQQGARCPECNKIKRSIKYSGNNCNFWKGGISNEPYCCDWIPEFKEIIKDRDGNKCLNPECSSGKLLSVHHINYNKKNCSKENLITVCRSCNSKANSNRKWHKSWYQAILHRRYNYQY